jgi:integrase
MGSIYRPAKTWTDASGKTHRKEWTIWWLKYYQNGKSIRESSGTDNRAAAKRMLQAREGDVSRGVPITAKTGKITFDEAVTDLENDYITNRRRSLDGVKRKIDLHLRPAFGRLRLANITTSHIRAFTVARQQAGAKNAEINRELSALKRMYSLAVQAGHLHHRPFVPMLAENNARQGFFEESQYRAVLAHLPPELRPVVTFAYLTGWRTKSEILPLEWRNVDLKACEVRLEAATTKNGETRELPYAGSPELVGMFKSLRAETTKLEQAQKRIIPFVFHRAGKRIRSFRGAWLAACKAAGCPGRIPHDLRRTAVRNMDQAGVSQSVAMQITGHKTASVYRRYRIVSTQDLRDALAKLTPADRGSVAPAKRQG